MSTSTSQSPDPRNQSAVDRALDQIRSAADGVFLIEPLADLDRRAAAYLAQRWSELPSATRLAVVQTMIDDAEQNIERTYSRSLLVAMRDSDAETRLAAIEGMSELESAEYLDVLLATIEAEPDERVRAAKASALGRFAMQSELGELDEQTSVTLRDALYRLLTIDPSREVRRRALESAGYLAGDQVVIEAIDAAYDSGDHLLRVSAIHAMGRQVDSRWLDLLHLELENEDPEIRYEAVVAIGSIGEERSVVELIDRLRDDDVEVQMSAISALGSIGGKLAVSVLRRLVEDDSEAIVDAAEEALEEAELTSDPLRPLM